MSKKMVRKKIILNLLISTVLIYDVIGKKNILHDKTSPEQLRAKSKRSVKTIKTKYGDVYDCIDFNEQPAFDHPLLKNHNYHFDMKPSSIPNEIPDKEDEKMKNKLKLKPIRCPRGTVPIRRTPRENSMEEKPSQTDAAASIYYAGTATKDGIGKIYGAAATISLENPNVDSNQYSSSIISIGAGHEFLHAGWTVNPKLYGDNNTRLYIWMQAANESCYNTKCPGFVIVDTDYPLDVILLDADATAGPRLETRVLIYQEKKSGNWWVVGPDDRHIGFWPKHLFSTLSNGANKAYYGGVVAVQSGDTNFAQMGRGSRPNKDDPDKNAISRHITIVNQDGSEEYATSKSNILESLSKRYVARNLRMHVKDPTKYWASAILFGGN